MEVLKKKVVISYPFVEKRPSLCHSDCFFALFARRFA